MKYLFTLLLLNALAFADYYPVRFQEGFTYSAEHTHLFTTPDLSAEVVTPVPPGELLEIEEFTGQTIEIESCNWGWYKAKYRVENSIYQGFVLDKHLAFASILIGNDSIFVFNLSSFNTTDNAFEGRLSLIAGGEILQSINYQPNWTPYGRMFDYDVTLTQAESTGLSNVSHLFIFYSGLDVSELQSREDIIVLTNDNLLITGPQAISIYKDNESRSETKIILPLVSSDIITLIHTIDCFEESTNSWIRTDEYSTVYQWEANTFREVNTTP